MNRLWAVFRFEWRRSLTPPRIAWWCVLALFPVLIVALIRFSARWGWEGSPPHPGIELPAEFWSISLFAMVPMLVSMLGTFLWMTPVVSAELERKSWIYLAVRPHGAIMVVLGKYVAGVTWVLAAAAVGLTLSVIAAPAGNGWLNWRVMVALTLLSCPAYAAVYLAIGVLFPRRAMMLAVAYTLMLELGIAFIQAVVNKVTVQYRLRALMVDWTEIMVGTRRNAGMMNLIGDAPAVHHVAVLLGYTLGVLLLAAAIIRWREFTSAEEAGG